METILTIYPGSLSISVGSGDQNVGDLSNSIWSRLRRDWSLVPIAEAKLFLTVDGLMRLPMQNWSVLAAAVVLVG